MDADQLADTTMDPRTRMLRRIRMEDAQQASEVFDLLRAMMFLRASSLLLITQTTSIVPKSIPDIGMPLASLYVALYICIPLYCFIKSRWHYKYEVLVLGNFYG